MSPEIPPALDRAAGYSWRLLVIGVALLAVARGVSELRLVLLPVFVAALLTTALAPATGWLSGRGVPRLAATWLTFLGFFGLLAALGALIVPGVATEFEDLEPTLTEGVDEIEDWLVTGPFELDRQTVVDARADIEEAVGDAVRSRGLLVSGTLLVAEVLAGTVLALVVTFFVIKDGEQLQTWALDLVPEGRRERARQAGRATWLTLAGYLKGAAALGLIEGVIISVTLALVGSSVVLPVGVLTFLAAFVPFVGAVVAGIVAVLVALVAGGIGDAAVVAVVALLVQQFDNELLAPLVYSRAVHLHPLVVILAVATGATISGVIGAFLAVPLTAVAVNVARAVTADTE